MKQLKTKCAHCGASTVKYTFSLNVGLIQSLTKLYEQYGRNFGAIRDLNLTRTQWTNFQKLRYWGLIARNDSLSKRLGIWQVTELGERFLRGEESLFNIIVMYRNEFVEFQGEKMLISEITDKSTKTRGEYVASSIPAHT